MQKIKMYSFLLVVGGCLYCVVELLFRGHTHWTMFFLGGIIFWFCGWQQIMLDWKEPLWKQCFRTTIFLSSLEFTCGIIVNKWLKWDVWDYSNMKYQLYGQISPLFTLAFAFLSLLGIILSGYLMHWFWGEKKPIFKLF